MSLDNPPPPWAPSQWNEYIDGFHPPVDPLLTIGAPAAPPVAPPAELVAAAPPPEAVDPSLPPVAALPTPELLTPPSLVPESPPVVPAPAPNLGEPDAISGGMTPQQVNRIVGRTDAQGATSAAPTATPDDYLSDEELGVSMSNRSPEEQAMFLGKIQAAHNNFAASRALEASETSRKRAEQNVAIRAQAMDGAQKRTAALDAEATRIADEDPMGNIPGYRKLAGVLASIVGGFASSSTGGRNVGLETVNRIADEAAQHQSQRLQVNARQRQGVGEQAASAEDAYHAGEAARLATYDTAIKSLESEVQLFDPRGSTASRVMGNLNQIKAQRAASLTKYQTDQQKRIEEVLKLEHDNAQLVETQRHNVVGEKTDMIRAYADATRAKAEGTKAAAETETLSPEYYESQGLPKPATAISKKDYSAWIENKGKAQQQSNQSLTTTNVVPNVTLKDRDGKDAPFIATGNAESVEKLRMRESKIRELVSLIDDARRTRTGWSSDTGNSTEKQELTAIWGKAKIAAKDAFELGQITAADEALIKGALGTDDPSKLRDPLPGMKKARERLILGMRGDLEAHGLPRGQYDIPDMQKNAATNTIDQFDLKFVLGTQHAKAPDDPGFGKFTMSDQQRGLIDKWEQDLNSEDPQVRTHAAEWISQTSQKAALPDVKAYAKAALDRAANQPPPTSPEELTGEVH